jgi:hypothetical protein
MKLVLTTCLLAGTSAALAQEYVDIPHFFPGPNLVLEGNQSLISGEMKQRLDFHLEHAGRLALEFARSERVEITRYHFPTRIALYKDPKELARATRLPLKCPYGVVCARMDLDEGVIFLGQRTPWYIHAELGKWFFFHPAYRWGHNQAEDHKRLLLAKRFADFVMARAQDRVLRDELW